MLGLGHLVYYEVLGLLAHTDLDCFWKFWVGVANDLNFEMCLCFLVCELPSLEEFESRSKEKPTLRAIGLRSTPN